LTGNRSSRPAALLAVSLAIVSFAAFACMRTAPAQSDSASGPPSGLECRLRVEAPVKAGGPVVLHFSLSQPAGATKSLYALRWYTPLEGVRGDSLKVERGGVELPYQGPMVKRGDPAAEDYVALAPGNPAEGSTDIGPAYGLTQPGTYTIGFRAGLADLVDDKALVPRPRDAHQPAPLTCPPVRFEIGP
jgi:hypothetical protein